jgi:hypothetical protein
MRSTSFVLASTCLSLAFCSAAAGGETKASKPGDGIKYFLHRLIRDGLPIEFYGLNLTRPLRPSANPPTGEYFDNETKPHFVWPSRLTNNRCSDAARKALAEALVSLPPSSQKAIRPDYCIIYREPEGTNTILWIDSSAKQMLLCESGQPCPYDIADIADPRTGTVRGALLKFLGVVERPYNEIKSMQIAIAGRKLAFDLMSIDPKQADDVVGKHWNVLGKKSINGGDVLWDYVEQALNLALVKDRQPAFAAEDFRPQLGLSTKFDSHRYVLLLSYESRLAEIYVDGESHGCYAISPGWVPQGSNEGLAFRISSDQRLCDILAADKLPLKPKSSPSGN